MQALRSATASHHAAIEDLLQLDGSAELRRFGAALQVFEAFLRVWEPLAAKALPLAMRPWFEAHRRGQLAAGDLRALRLPAIDLESLPRLPMTSPAMAIGSAYVIEGSALGGLVIAKSMADRFGIAAGNGASYFSARGRSTAAVWREFCAHLEQELANDPAATAQACDAACLTFERLAQAFGGHLPAQAAGSVK